MGGERRKERGREVWGGVDGNGGGGWTGERGGGGAWTGRGGAEACEHPWAGAGARVRRSRGMDARMHARMHGCWPPPAQRRGRACAEEPGSTAAARDGQIRGFDFPSDAGLDQSRGSEPLVKVAGQSRWSKSLVKVAGQSRWSKSLVKVAGQSRGSKSLVKVAGQSRGSKPRVKVAGQSRGSSPQVSSVGKTGQTRCGFG